MSQLCLKLLHTRHLQQIANSICNDDSHPVFSEIQLRPSSQRFKVLGSQDCTLCSTHMLECTKINFENLQTVTQTLSSVSVKLQSTETCLSKVKKDLKTMFLFEHLLFTPEQHNKTTCKLTYSPHIICLKTVRHNLNPKSTEKLPLYMLCENDSKIFGCAYFLFWMYPIFQDESCAIFHTRPLMSQNKRYRNLLLLLLNKS